MSTGKPISAAIRIAAINDYRNTGDSMTVVARRRGLPRTTLARWVKRADTADIAYRGGWERDGLILRPRSPERRSA